MNNTTPSSFEQDSSLSNVGVKAASLFIFILVGIYRNGRVIYTVLLGDTLRPVLNLFVASLSFADLASCLIVMPFVFVSLVSGEWLFGSIFCTIHAMLCTYFANVYKRLHPLTGITQFICPSPFYGEHPFVLSMFHIFFCRMTCRCYP